MFNLITLAKFLLPHKVIYRFQILSTWISLGAVIQPTSSQTPGCYLNDGRNLNFFFFKYSKYTDDEGIPWWFSNWTQLCLRIRTFLAPEASFRKQGFAPVLFTVTSAVLATEPSTKQDSINIWRMSWILSWKMQTGLCAPGQISVSLSLFYRLPKEHLLGSCFPRYGENKWRKTSLVWSAGTETHTW